ncbi:NAD(P)-dependent oxidoreductase [Arthrobacter sp. NPDC056493]|uniref:NAD(P)-dependent oxidoreductase n=1 Tax=Arthrobacter sp. NPDC056493 TaxID=3345839 RepID=UPI0036725B0D
MVKVGFIGLGLMGRHMASNILSAGYELVVFDLNPQAAEALVESGAKLAASVAELTRLVDVLFTSLPGPTEIEQVVLGAEGVLANATKGFVLYDLSTSSRSLSRRMAEEFEKVGAHMLDAPVSGGPPGAESGDLAIWVGGEQNIFERHEDLLKAVGKSAVHVGAVGSGNVVKLTHNLLGFMLWEAMAEVFSVGVKAGVEPLDLWKALRLGSAGKQSPLDLLVNQFLPGTFDEPAFALKLAYKDAVLGTGLANELGVPLRLANLVKEEMTEAMALGYGDRDARSFLTLQLERSGTKIAVDPDKIKEAVAE